MLCYAPLCGVSYTSKILYLIFFSRFYSKNLRPTVFVVSIKKLFCKHQNNLLQRIEKKAGNASSLYLFSFCSSMNEVVHTSPTIGSNVEEIVVNNTHFLMWDIGGQESLRSSWNTYYTNTEVRFIFCWVIYSKSSDIQHTQD